MSGGSLRKSADRPFMMKPAVKTLWFFSGVSFWIVWAFKGRVAF